MKPRQPHEKKKVYLFYVSSGRKPTTARTSSGQASVRGVASEWAGRFLRGPLQSGVLQQVMQTELSLPVQNCW